MRSRPVSVLHVMAEILPSGGETMLASASEYFTGEGIASTVLSTGGNVGSFAGELKSKGYRIAHLPFRKSPRFFIEFYRFLRREKFDVVHVHTERAFFYLLAVAWLARVPTKIRTVHHIFPWSGWLSFRSRVQRHVAKSVFGATFVSNSISGQENERKCYGMDNILIPNWYDSRRFRSRTREQYAEARRRLKVADGTFLLISLGGNSDYKNYPLLIESLAEVRSETPVLYLQIGSEGPGAPLSTLVAKMNLASRVKCCGRVDDPMPYLFAGDAFAMPSSIEGFGVAAAEAMAVGLPVILSRRPALSDFANVSDQIVWVDCERESIATGVTRLLNESEGERWDRGQALAASIPCHCGLGIGPALFSQLYQGSLTRVHL